MKRVMLLPFTVTICFLDFSVVEVLSQTNPLLEKSTVMWKCASTTKMPIAGTCRGDSIPCNNGVCIPLNWKCDGKPDCLTGEDEASCTDCKTNEFRCNNKHCIKLSQVCDKKEDCEDGHDEQNCPTSKCRKNTIPCNNGVCIPAGWRCDGKKDCLQGEDEEFCPKSKCGMDMPCKDLEQHQRYMKKILSDLHTGFAANRNDLENLKNLPSVLNITFPYEGSKKALEIVGILEEKLRVQNNLLQGILSRMTSTTNAELEELNAILKDILGNISNSDPSKWLVKANVTIWQMQLLLGNFTTFFPVAPEVKLEMVVTKVTETEKSFNSRLEGMLKNITEKLEKVEKTTINVTMAPTTLTTPTTTTTTVPTTTVSTTPIPLVMNETAIPKTLQKLNKSVKSFPQPALDVGAGGCRKGFIKEKDSCYYFSKYSGVYAGVSFICKDWGSNLVNVDSAEENAFLRLKTSSMSKYRRIYHGATDILDEYSFLLDDKWEPLHYANWGALPYYKEYPHSKYKANCAAMTKEHTVNSVTAWIWIDVRCADSLWWICEQNLTEEASNVIKNETMEDFTLRLKDFKESLRLLSIKLPVNSTSKCPEGFWKRSTGCYYLSRDVAQWYLASYRCKELGGWVADINSAQEQQEIDSIFSDVSFRAQGSQYWIGAHGLNKQGAILSDKTYKPLTYANWVKPAVDQESCVYYFITDKRWYETPCNSEFSFVCEAAISL